MMVRYLRRIPMDQLTPEEQAGGNSLVGQPVSLSRYYSCSNDPTLIAVDGELATLQFPNGVVMQHVPLSDVVGDHGYWTDVS